MVRHKDDNFLHSLTMSVVILLTSYTSTHTMNNLYSRDNNNTMVRVAAEVEEVPTEANNTRGRRVSNLAILPGHQLEDTLENLSSSLYIIFDIGVLLYFISSVSR